MTPEAHILIVDDDLADIMILHEALQGQGQIRYATGGLDALKLLAGHPCDLVLLNANMPEMDGFAIFQAIQQDYPELPVLFVTGDSDVATEVRALESGARDFITKPINPLVVRARVGVHLQLKALYDRMFDLSNRDPLTGLANRRALDERVAQEWRRAARHGLPLGLIMIDIGHFKAYNDHYGHVQGDDCLRQVAETLVETVRRSGDLVARFGGEEFAVLLPGSDTATARALGEKIRAAVARRAVPHACSGTAPEVTLSLGAASLWPMITSSDRGGASAPSAPAGEAGLGLAHDLFERADRALYAAKAAGRNQVSVADADPATAATALTLVWSRQYASGHPLIDEDHRALFQQANALLELALAELPPATLIPALDALIVHIRAHFAREEIVLGKAGYPDTAAHAHRHGELIARAMALRDQAEVGELAFGDLVEYLAKEMVMQHLLQDDRQFFSWLRQAEWR
jgi:diguanylate cyclase (GGDEF)-like protein/hemerythrin-like metal-binding protein